MKTSRDRWIENRYPLIEAGMSRQDCAEWWAALWSVIGILERRQACHHSAGFVMTPTSSLSVSGSWLRLRWLFQRCLT